MDDRQFIIEHLVSKQFLPAVVSKMKVYMTQLERFNQVNRIFYEHAGRPLTDDRPVLDISEEEIKLIKSLAEVFKQLPWTSFNVVLSQVLLFQTNQNQSGSNVTIARPLFSNTKKLAVDYS